MPRAARAEMRTPWKAGNRAQQQTALTLSCLWAGAFRVLFAQSKMTEGETEDGTEVPSNLWLHGLQGGWDSQTYLL